MTAVDLSLALDGVDAGPPRYRGGDVVRGRVIVDAHRDVECRSVTIQLQWRTHGHGTIDIGNAQKAHLFDGSWRAGERYRYRFQLELPRFPLTYHGRDLNIDWYLTAKAEVPLAIDAHHELELLVAPGAETDEHVAALPQWTVGERRRLDSSTASCAALIMLAGFVVMLGDATLKISGNAVLFVSVAFVVVLPALAVFVATIWNSLAETKLGHVVVTASEVVTAGDEVAVKVLFVPPRRVTVNAVEVALVGQERSSSGFGSSETVRLHELARVRKQLRGRDVLPGRVRFEEETALVVPADAAPSFQASKNSISWTVEVKVDVPFWPDWGMSVPVVVLPRFATTARLNIGRKVTISVQPGQRCPYCRSKLAGALPSQLKTCGGCRTVFHRECISELGACSTRGCRNYRPARARG